MSLNYLTLTLNVVDGAGTPAYRGFATIAPSAYLTDAVNNLDVVVPVLTQFDSAASPVVRLLATDNATLQPSGWAWTITFSGVPRGPAAYNFFLPAGPQTFTATNASPAVFTGSGAGYLSNTGVQLSGGSLPAGFAAGVTYWVVGASGSTFQLAATAGGAPLGSTSTGSGSVVAVQSYLSSLSPVSSVTTMAAYMPLPSGTPSSGQVPVATGSGEASAWGNVPVNPMTTSGDTIYGGASGTLTRLAGDTSNTRKFLREQSSAGVAQPPAWDTIAAGDVPTLNQNTTGTAAGLSATLAIGSGGTGQVTAAAAYNALSPMTTTGDLEYESGANTASRLAGNTSATKKFLTQTGNGSVSAAPGWNTIAAGDLPTLDQVPAAAASVNLNSQKITSLANGTATTDAAAYGQVLAAEPSWLPSDAGFLAWTYDAAGATGTFTMVSGTVYLFRVNIRAALSCTNVITIIGTAGSGLTSGQNFAGLYSSAGTRIGITADQTTPWATAGLQTMALAGGPFALSAGFYWVAMLAVGTTPPIVLSAAGTFRASNAGTAVSVARYATNGTGATALPASITPASNSLLSPAVWAAIS